MTTNITVDTTLFIGNTNTQVQNIIPLVQNLANSISSASLGIPRTGTASSYTNYNLNIVIVPQGTYSTYQVYSGEWTANPDGTKTADITRYIYLDVNNQYYATGNQSPTLASVYDLDGSKNPWHGVGRNDSINQCFDIDLRVSWAVQRDFSMSMNG